MKNEIREEIEWKQLKQVQQFQGYSKFEYTYGPLNYVYLVKNEI